MTLEELSKLFPQRTYDAVRSRMWVLKLKRDKEYLKQAKTGSMWTDEELKTLRENFNRSVKDLQVLLPSRSADAIRGKRRNLS